MPFPALLALAPKLATVGKAVGPSLLQSLMGGAKAQQDQRQGAMVAPSQASFTPTPQNNQQTQVQNTQMGMSNNPYYQQYLMSQQAPNMVRMARY